MWTFSFSPSPTRFSFCLQKIKSAPEVCCLYISSIFFLLQFFSFKIIYEIKDFFNFIPNRFSHMLDLVLILLIIFCFILDDFSNCFYIYNFIILEFFFLSNLILFFIAIFLPCKIFLDFFFIISSCNI